MASSIDNAFITQYGRRKPKMPQKRNRVRKVGIVPVPKETGTDPSKYDAKKRDKELRDRVLGKPKPKLKPPKRGDKKFKLEKPIYRGEPLGNGKSSQEV